ncbi:hypothetical protein CC1G_02864 [Coprinopsis cinerea okayama7|uniref:Aminotransferase class I/classII large domain-containing protein n=1 Tax=Coprinopsis cinerea (strain Okayama-7 / 130 / ATCC MYA-4618 / FGSC 9003) TaxID=240176 RepID=A8N095_COPC7|nr:hypothetical protein CC1G_02864 [Coprinopsis cinerea okayama7\|eukprot:XP_001828283.2 hypothetical protein CC1G_02864 [Coprinopsis cinerea okayama7\
MSLSEQGKTRAALVLPGGPLHALFTAIQNEWSPDFKDGISRLDVSENDLMGKEMATILKSFAAEANHNWLTYQGSATPSCSIKLLESLATLINNRFRPRQVITPDQLVGGAGCSLLLEGLTRIICDDGDIILTPAPIWPIFHTIVANANVSLSVVSSYDATATTFGEQAEVISSLLDWSEATKTRWTTRVQQLRSSGKKPRAVLLSNPQNPLGRCYSRSFILGILDFCQENDLFLISDEVFALSHHHYETINGYKSTRGRNGMYPACAYKLGVSHGLYAQAG